MLLRFLRTNLYDLIKCVQACRYYYFVNLTENIAFFISPSLLRILIRLIKLIKPATVIRWISLMVKFRKKSLLFSVLRSRRFHRMRKCWKFLIHNDVRKFSLQISNGVISLTGFEWCNFVGWFVECIFELWKTKLRTDLFT
jgi:hypothetical protein